MEACKNNNIQRMEAGYIWDIEEIREASAGFFVGRYSRADIPAHMHAHRYIQIQFVLQGSLTHAVDGGQHIISGGQLYVIAPLAFHQITPTHPEGEIAYYSIGFLPEFITGLFSDIRDDVPPFLDYIIFSDYAKENQRAYPKITLSDVDLAFVRQKIELIADEFTRREEGHIPMIRAMLAEVFVRLGRAWRQEGVSTQIVNRSKHYGDVLRRCLAYIELHFRMNLKLDDIASFFGFSRTSFCAHFKLYTGTTFYTYLNRLRIRYAKSMIALGNGSITEVALANGFCDYSTFARCFKREVGLSPSEYRAHLDAEGA